MHPLRFVAQVPRPLVEGPPATAWVETARRVEDLGYTALSLPDHLGDQFAPLPALTAAAAVTSTLGLTTTVLANDLRHPAMLAKDVATIDVLSGGRVTLGIGAGWMITDYTATGIPLDPPGVRIERLAEAVAVLRGAWADEPFSLEGRHYRIADLDGRPKPVQRPGPPVVLGGGARRMLTLAGRLGDGVNIALDNRAGVSGAASGRTTVEEAMEERVAWVRAGAGDRFDSLPLGLRVLMVEVTDDPLPAAERLGHPMGLSGVEVLASPHALVGPIEALAERVVGLRERWGVSSFTFSANAVEPLAPLVARLAGT